MPRQVCLYTDDTAIIATYRQLALLINYLESYLSDQKRWLRKWRIAINIPKNTATIFAKAGRHIPTSLAFREPIHCVDAACYLGVTLATWLTLATYINKVRKWHRE
jgi:hypothetical protein